MASKSQPFAKIDTRELIHLQDSLKLSAYAQLVLLELLCGRHHNMIGFYKVDLMHAVIGKHLQLDVATVGQAFQELQGKDLIVYDPESEVVLVKEKFRHSGIQNSDMAKKACYVLSTVPDNSLFEEFASMLADIIEAHEETERNYGKDYKPETGGPSEWYKTLYRSLIENRFIQGDLHGVLHSVKHGVIEGDGHMKMYMDMKREMKKEIHMERGSKGENQSFEPSQHNPNVQELNRALFSLLVPRRFSHEDIKAIAEKACEYSRAWGIEETLKTLKESLVDETVQPSKILQDLCCEVEEEIPTPL